MFKRSKPPPPAATVATDPIDQTDQVLQTVDNEKHQVASESEGSGEANVDATEKKKKPPSASLGNYFVRYCTARCLHEKLTR